MNWTFSFFFNSLLLGVGLAMDAFSVSMANGLAEPAMRKKKLYGIAGTFAFFQALMPMAGWICVHSIVRHFKAAERLTPWIALILLLFIGGKMVMEGLRNGGDQSVEAGLGISALMLQGVATSIDALSVGFTIAEYGFFQALTCALIIAAVTFGICVAGLYIGRKVGNRFSGKASILGGLILIGIGIEIFVRGVL